MKRRDCPLRETTLPEEWGGGVADAAEEVFFTEREEEILHETIAEMEEPARTVFIMRYFYFEKVKDIAAALDLPDKKVENILLREKKKLRTILMQKGIER